MRFQNHGVGIFIILFTIFQSSQYFSLLLLVAMLKLFSQRARIPRSATLAILPLPAMILIGLIFAYNNDFYDALKDIWYLTKALLATLIGLMIGLDSKPHSGFLRITSIYAGLALIIELVLLGVAVGSGDEYDILPALAPIFVIVFYIRSKDMAHSYDFPLKFGLGTLVLAVMFLSLSRTMFLTAIVTWFGAAGTFSNRARTVLSATILASVLMVSIPMLPQYDPTNITFLGKVQNSISEIGFVEDDDMTRVTTNWRGFESYKAYMAWLDGTLGEKVFGHGLGASVDIGFYYSLSDDYSVRFLPVLHNGYFMVLVKYGVLGLLLFIAFMVSPFFLKAERSEPSVLFYQNIGVTASVLLIITTVSITGPLNLSKLDGITLMLGWAIGMHTQGRATRLKHWLKAPRFPNQSQKADYVQR